MRIKLVNDYCKIRSPKFPSTEGSLQEYMSNFCFNWFETAFGTTFMENMLKGFYLK